MDNQTHLQQLVDIHGSNFDHWDEDDAKWARQYIAGNLDARELFDHQRALEQLLNTHLPHEFNPDLANSITCLIKPERPGMWLWKQWLNRSLWRPLFVASLPLIIGILGGIYYPLAATDDAESIALLAFSEFYEEYQSEE